LWRRAALAILEATPVARFLKESSALSRLLRPALAIFLICAVSLWAAPAGRAVAKSEAPLMVEGLRTGDHLSSTRIVIDLNHKADFRVFHLSSPLRIVIDLPPASWRAPKAQLMSGRLLQGYRSGLLEDGLTRIIFDLKSPAVVTEAFTLPRDSFERDRLVLDLRNATETNFEAHLPDVFGNRSLKGPGFAPSPLSGVATLRDVAVRQAAPRPPPAATAAPPQHRDPEPPRQLNSAQKRIYAEKHHKYTIVVDAGHGGDDPGASGPGGIKEKNITLAVARELERQLQDTGRYTVVLTRDRDVYIQLRERVDISRRVKGDLFVSIHADKIARTGVRGASIYTLSERASDAETARLADDENNSGVVAGVDLAAESEDVAGILLDLAMREKMNESKVLSRSLETAFMNNNVGLLPNSHRAAGFAVLKAPDVPSVLIETGFLSNPSEAKLLSTPQFQRRIAGAIVDGVDAYFRKMQTWQKM
jgi:N-acetylmuramoyl-L-alanine amidase